MAAQGYGALDKLSIIGGIMAGDIILAGNPAESLGAIPQQYADLGFAGVVVYTGTAWPARPATVGFVLWVGTVAPPTGTGGAVPGDGWWNPSGSGGSGVTIDTTATDIQPLGTRAAGAIGEAADAGHVHDMPLIPTGVKTASYSAASHDFVRVNTTSGAITVTLPNAPADRSVVGVMITTLGAGNPVTVACSGTDVINVSSGVTSVTLSRVFQMVVLQYIAVNKVWLRTGGDQAITFPAATQNFKPANPTGTVSATLVMMGLGTTCVFTPSGTGKVRVDVTAQAGQATAGQFNTAGGRYGTGTAPANGAAVTGTRFGGSQDAIWRTATFSGTNTGAQLGFTDILALTPGTAYWFDLALLTPVAADQAYIQNVSVTVQELIA